MELPLQDHEVQHHGQHTIEINEITNRGYDFDYFGWAFQVAQDGKPKFRMAITTAGLISEDDRDALRKWGLDWVKTMVDNGNYEAGGDYCFEWARGLGDPSPVVVNCEEARRGRA